MKSNYYQKRPYVKFQNSELIVETFSAHVLGDNGTFLARLPLAVKNHPPEVVPRSLHPGEE